VGGRFKDIPLLLCNPNLLKDAVFNAARRVGGGSSSLHFPRWLGAAFWDEFKAEVREPKGKWKKIRKRNEALDLACMNRAASLSLGADRLNWDNPPAWARPCDTNSERMTREERRAMQAKSSTPPKNRPQYGSDEWNNRL
jgi:phage terminase large subunit GpA-like protein